jgi:hypothetical protein
LKTDKEGKRVGGRDKGRWVREVEDLFYYEQDRDFGGIIVPFISSIAGKSKHLLRIMSMLFACSECDLILF